MVGGEIRVAVIDHGIRDGARVQLLAGTTTVAMGTDLWLGFEIVSLVVVIAVGTRDWAEG